MVRSEVTREAAGWRVTIYRDGGQVTLVYPDVRREADAIWLANRLVQALTAEAPPDGRAREDA